MALDQLTVNRQRCLKDSPFTAQVTFYDDDTATDPSTVTVKVEREDGTELVPAGTATSGTGAAARTYALTASHTASLDVLKLTWTSATKGTLVTFVEVVGGFLFTLADVRADSELDDQSVYPDAKIIAARTLAEEALEDACGVAFVPRYAREKQAGNSGCWIALDRRFPLSVQSASVSGTALTSAQLATLELEKDGRVYYPTGWHGGGTARRNVTVKYTHGHQPAPARASAAALKLAKRYLVDTAISDRAISVNGEDGTVQIMVTAGVRGAVFDVPECNALVEEYGQTAGAF